MKTALTPEVHPGQQASFSLVTTNKGPSDAQEVKLVDTLPAGLAYVSSSGASAKRPGRRSRARWARSQRGASVTVELVTQPAGLGSYTNTAVVSSTTPDLDPSEQLLRSDRQSRPGSSGHARGAADGSDSPGLRRQPEYRGSMARTKVTLRKLVREHEVAPGGRLDYRLIVRNAGAQTAEKLKVCDDLPEQTTVLNPGGGHLAGARICFTLARLAAGRSHTFALVLRADSDAGGQIVNHATVTGRNFDPAHARASTPVHESELAPARENHVTG